MSARQEGLSSPGWGYFAKSSFDNVLCLPKIESQHTVVPSETSACHCQCKIKCLSSSKVRFLRSSAPLVNKCDVGVSQSSSSVCECAGNMGAQGGIRAGPAVSVGYSKSSASPVP